MAYRLSAKAEDDLVEAYRESVRLFGDAQTQGYFAGLEAAFDFLAATPEAARERKETTPPVRIHPYRSHIVVYLIDDNGDILILRIRHGREDWETDPS